MSEWTRAVQVDHEGNIDFMYPEAVRYKKSRQEYDDKHEDKKPIFTFYFFIMSEHTPSTKNTTTL